MNVVRDVLERYFPKTGLKRGVFILSGGTALAQLIAFAVSPFLTRLYTVEDFGYLQIFNSIVAVLLVIAAGRYEVALPLPKDDETAVNLLAFALCVVLSMCTLVGICLWLCYTSHWLRAYTKDLSPFLWLVPICLAGSAFYQVFSYWSLRKKEYGLIARTRIVQVGSRFSLQLGAALLHFGLPGLLIGETVARANGTGSFLRGIWRNDSAIFKKINWADMRKAARSYREFSLVFSASGLLMSATFAIPSFLLVSFFGATVTGLFALVDRVLGIPSVLIGQSLQQVYMSEGAPLVHSDPIGLKHLFLKIIKRIYPIPLATCTFLVLFGPAVFAFAFGAKWREAGEYARILCMVELVGMLVAPVDATLTMLKLKTWRFAWDSGRLIFVTATMVGVHRYIPGAKAVIIAYAGSMMLFYAILLVISYIGINRLVARGLKAQALSG
jgi:O-antigen/teichoic acid export membrane protein